MAQEEGGGGRRKEKERYGERDAAEQLICRWRRLLPPSPLFSCMWQPPGGRGGTLTPILLQREMERDKCACKQPCGNLNWKEEDE